MSEGRVTSGWKDMGVWRAALCRWRHRLESAGWLVLSPSVIPHQGGSKTLDRGGENYEPNPEPRATVDSNAVRKQKTPPTVPDDRDPRAGLGRLHRRGEAQNTVANDQCQVLAGRPAHRQCRSAQREAPMCVHR